MYPTNIDKFSEKLNKRDEAYVIEEEILIANGVYEGMLAHDNIIDSSLSVYSGSKLTGLKIEDVILSVPEDTPWKRIIKIFSDYEKVYITYESYGDQVEAEDINRLQVSMTATQSEVDRYKTSTDLKVTELQNDVQSLENKKSDKTYVDTELNKKANKVDVYTKSQTDDRIKAVVGAAPEALDTLQEIGQALGNDPDFAGTMTNELSKKVDKISGKQLTTEDYTTADKNKLSGIETGANKYVHPSSHPATMITESSTKRFVTDAEKISWNAKETPEGAQEKADTAEQNAKTHSSNLTGNRIIDNRNVIPKPTDYARNRTTQEFKRSTSVGLGGDAGTYVHVFSERAWADNSGGYVRQLAYDGLTPKIWTRFGNQSTDAWGAWEELETTSGAQAKIDTHEDDSVKHITAAERAAWNAKSNLTLGESSTTAYRGDRGKVAYDHSQSSHAPSNAQKNSDITKDEIEAKLTGNIATHTHNQYVTQEQLGNAGYGDMTKAVYDTNNNGAVDKADSVPWTGVTGKPPSYPPNGHTHSISDISNLESELNIKINAVSVGSTADPNTTQTSYILTNHANSPGTGIYWHILTFFYSSKTGNRGQIAVSYNGNKPQLMMRHYYNQSWTEWRKVLDNKGTTWNDLKGV